MQGSTTDRRGFNLLELVAVLTLLGIFAAVAIARLSPATLGNVGAQFDSRRLALDLLQAQRRAITTGENHYLAFTSSGGNVTGYTLMRRLGGVPTAVDAARTFTTQLTVASTHTEAEYAFDGTALAAYQITLTASAQAWRVTVVPVTGAVKVVKL